MKPQNPCYLYECTQLLLSLAVDVHKPLCGATLKGSNYHLTPHHSNAGRNAGGAKLWILDVLFILCFKGERKRASKSN